MEPNLSANVDEIPGPVVNQAHADAYSAIDELLLGGEASTGVAMASLDCGARLLVRTRYSEYRVTVLDAESGDVIIEGGSLLQGETPARLNGATAGGCAMKLGWIGVGLRMELSVGGVRVTTSPVQSIEVENGISHIFLGGLQ